MPARHPAHARGLGAGPGAAAGEEPLRLAEGREPQVVRVPPAPTRSRPCRRRRAGAARSRCRSPPGCTRASPAPRPRSAAGRGRCRPRRRPGTKAWRSAAELLELQPGDEAREVEGVGADVADAAAGAGARRIGPPLGLLLARWPRPASPASPGRTRPARRGSSPSSPVAHHRPRLPDHRVAGVVVGEDEERVGLLGQPSASFFASASVVVSGLSQITWMPRFRKPRAAGACMWFGVTIATASMPFFRRASRLAIVVEVVVDAVRARPRAAPEACAFSGVEDSAPATSSYSSSSRAAMRWTAPMKASLPPPTMPSRMRGGFVSLMSFLPVRSPRRRGSPGRRPRRPRPRW